MSSSTRRVVSPSPTVASSSLHHRMASKELRPPKSWELILPSEGWMYDGDEEEKEIGGMEPSIEKEEVSKEDEEEEDSKEDPRKTKKKKTPRRRSLLLPLCLWMWMPTRTIYSTWRYVNILPSTLPSIVVRLQYQICPRIHRIDVSLVMALRVMIFLEYGHRHYRVRVSRVPHHVSTKEA
ncbi:hypothetical protein PIB30_047632 [Stylosanthes scabra]|uniref:Uncharacterized protein n=1 Tax=Stylosanthes scabra TaxID=79078 RepID=A0ABU6TIR1_9FABA|nr:hypothetical protein [Stylosanthes scabra]